MTASEARDVSAVLHGLIGVCRDGEQGFRTAATGVDDPTLRRLFESYAEQRGSFARELQAEVARRDGEPARSGDVAGAALHRGWMKIHEAVSGNDEAAILTECERREDAAVRAYRDAVDQTIPGDTADLVERLYVQVKDAHDHVRMLERSHAGATPA
jgi:uncharacterized protein (TIGR02284 family)